MEGNKLITFSYYIRKRKTRKMNAVVKTSEDKV